MSNRPAGRGGGREDRQKRRENRAVETRNAAGRAADRDGATRGEKEILENALERKKRKEAISTFSHGGRDSLLFLPRLSLLLSSPFSCVPLHYALPPCPGARYLPTISRRESAAERRDAGYVGDEELRGNSASSCTFPSRNFIYTSVGIADELSYERTRPTAFIASPGARATAQDSSRAAKIDLEPRFPVMVLSDMQIYSRPRAGEEDFSRSNGIRSSSTRRGVDRNLDEFGSCPTFLIRHRPPSRLSMDDRGAARRWLVHD